MTEVELKLAADAEALKRLAAAPALTARTRGKVVTLRLDNRYFDTPDLELYHNRLALRVRKTGRRYVQTLKADPDPSEVIRREEWEAPVNSSRPDLRALPDPLPLRPPGRIRADRLKSLFSSRICREVRIIETSGTDGATSEIEVAIDRGVVEAKRRSLPVSEIELQLLRGEPGALYQVAIELQRVAPLRLMTLSKSARGYGLAVGMPPRWRKAERLRLDPAATTEDALSAVVKACQSHWTANEAAAVDGRDPEGVHQVRVGLRRFRSALTVFADLVPEDQRPWLKAEAKWALDALGPAREWDVLATELLPMARKKGLAPDVVRALASTVQRERRRAQVKARRALRSARYTRLQLRLGMWIEGRGWRNDGANAGLDRPAVEFADGIFAARYRKVMKLGRDIDAQSVADRHRLRLALKKLRYSTEFFRSLYRKGRVAAYLKRLTRLQDDLGRYNDMAVAESLLKPLTLGADESDKADLARAAAAVITWHRRRLAAGEKELRRDWRDFAWSRPFWSDDRR